MKSNAFVPLFLALFVGTSCLITSCRNAPTYATSTIPTLSVGIQNSPSNALIIVADAQKLFDSTQVKVTIKEFAAGKLALQAMLGQANDLDVASSAETPVVLASLGGNAISVFSQVVNAKNECRVVVHKDLTRTTPETYFAVKRKLATSQGGSPEWLTYNFIKRYKLDKTKIEIVAVEPANMPATLTSKAVDAISIFDPFARIGEQQLGDKGQTFLNENITTYYVLSAKKQTLDQKTAAIAAFMAGLRKAQTFINTQPEEAKKIVAARTKLDRDIINATWKNYTFGVDLDNGFLDLCKNEANWAIETGKYPRETKIPDFKTIVVANAIRQPAETPAH